MLFDSETAQHVNMAFPSPLVVLCSVRAGPGQAAQSREGTGGGISHRTAQVLNKILHFSSRIVFHIWEGLKWHCLPCAQCSSSSGGTWSTASSIPGGDGAGIAAWGREGTSNFI